MSEVPRTSWGARAAQLYTDAYAERYHAQDMVEADAAPGQASVRLAGWLRRITERYDRPIDVLDLGCGTGRYFHALANVRRLVGVDVSRPMLERAAHPVGAEAIATDRLTLVEGDFLVHDFGADEFDLVYAIGVLAEHSPFDAAVVMRVARWLRPGGRFAFTTVDPGSPSVPSTVRRGLGRTLLRVPLPDVLRARVRTRLMSGGMYADEHRVRDVLESQRFVVESIEPFESDVHRHVLAVAVKQGPPDRKVRGEGAPG